MVTRVCSGPSAKRYRLQGNITTHTPKDYVDVFKHHKVNRAVVLCAYIELLCCVPTGLLLLLPLPVKFEYLLSLLS